MSYEERTGIRSLLYSGWHRVESTGLLIGRVAASKLHMIDIDACEYCCYCREPVALMELQCSTSPPKPAPVMSRLAWMAGVSAWSVSVEPSTSSPPTVARFQVQQQLVPVVSTVTVMSPHEYASWLLALRDQHMCRKRTAA